MMKRKLILLVKGFRVENIYLIELNCILYIDLIDDGLFYCIIKEGVVVFQYDYLQLFFFCGIVIDREGNIYVVGYKFNNIYELFFEGELQRLIVFQIYLFQCLWVFIENGGFIYVIYGKYKVLELLQIIFYQND